MPGIVKAPKENEQSKGEGALGRGFLAGTFWGVIVGIALLLVSNMTMERQQLSFPRPEAVPVEVPAGSEFDQARPETDPVVPEVETRPGGEVASGVASPPDAVETPPTFDTSSLEVPQPTVDAPGGLGALPEIADDATVDVTGPGPADGVTATDEPSLEVPDAPAAAPERATEAPASAPTPEVAEPAPAIEDSTLSAMAAPEVDDSAGIVTPADEDTPDTTPLGDAEPAVETSPAAETAAAAAPVTSEAPSVMTAPVEAPSGQATIRVDGEEGSFFKPVEGIGDLAKDVETDRLPRIAAAAPAPAPAPEAGPDTGESGTGTLPVVRRLPGVGDDAPAAPESPPDAAPIDGPALQAWRQPFESDATIPLFSIVLVHDGPEPDAAIVTGLPNTVSFAIDAGLPNAAVIAAGYRALGREVVMIPALPMGATPQDVEVALRVNLETVPEAVAIMDASGAGFQSDREAVAQVVDVAAATGHGLITFPRGLNTAHQRAGRVGVPTGLIFRDIDGDDQTEEQIRRAMDRAAFRARTDRPVILVGRTAPGTFAAIREWVIGDRADSVDLAPVSAALLRGNS